MDQLGKETGGDAGTDWAKTPGWVRLEMLGKKTWTRGQVWGVQHPLNEGNGMGKSKPPMIPVSPSHCYR